MPGLSEGIPLIRVLYATVCLGTCAASGSRRVKGSGEHCVAPPLPFDCYRFEVYHKCVERFMNALGRSWEIFGLKARINRNSEVTFPWTNF